MQTTVVNERQQLLNILRKAKNLIENENRWTTECFSVNESGEDICPWDDSAYAFCALGAIQAITRERNAQGTLSWKAEKELSKAVDRLGIECTRIYGICDIGEINDHDGHAQVMRIYDDAICHLESQLAVENK